MADNFGVFLCLEQRRKGWQCREESNRVVNYFLFLSFLSVA